MQRYSILQRLTEGNFLSKEQLDQFIEEEKKIDFSNADLSELLKIDSS